MGLINNDSYETPFGTSLTGTYISVATNTMYVFRVETGYMLRYTATVWATQEARTEGKASVSTTRYGVTLTGEQLAQGIYDLAYADLKTKYPNTTDV